MDAPPLKQKKLRLTKWIGFLGLIIHDYTTCFVAERLDHADATSLSLSCYTKKFLSQHLARSTARTKRKAWCNIATSLLLYRRLLLAWVAPIFPTWIRVSWANTMPICCLLSVATAVTRLIWVLSSLRDFWQSIRHDCGQPTLPDSTNHIETLRTLVLYAALEDRMFSGYSCAKLFSIDAHVTSGVSMV